MATHTYLDQGVTILKTQLAASMHKIPAAGSVIHPFITISRESCVGANALAQELIPLLNTKFGEAGRSWIFFDKDLITHALTKHQLPERLAEYLPEDRIPEIKALIGELVGLHPSVWDLEKKISEVIRQLARLGCVILTDRASNFLTHDLPGGLHLRLVAPLETRIKRMMSLKNCDEMTARNALLGTDQARYRYVRANFQKDVEDPHGYDLVINTDQINPVCAAQLVVNALHDRIQALSALRTQG